MKIKAAELIGAALDWAVAKALGLEEVASGGTRCWVINGITHAINGMPPRETIHYQGQYDRLYSPSTYWAQGGPLIEQEKITLRNYPPFNSAIESLPERWLGELDHNIGGLTYCMEVYGPTALIAALRCYVAAKHGGEDIDIPEGLCGGVA